MSDTIVFKTEISSSTWTERSTAPNGSSSSIDYWTSVVSCQDWADVPANGIYAGRSYKITDLYLSTRLGTRGQFITSSSRPWVQ